jgi:hypothetical protein
MVEVAVNIINLHHRVVRAAHIIHIRLVQVLNLQAIAMPVHGQVIIQVLIVRHAHLIQLVAQVQQGHRKAHIARLREVAAHIRQVVNPDRLQHIQLLQVLLVLHTQVVHHQAVQEVHHPAVVAEAEAEDKE